MACAASAMARGQHQEWPPMNDRATVPTPTIHDVIIRDRATAPTVPCPCGSSTRLLTVRDGAPMNVHVTTIHDSAPHYHRHCTEVYYVLEGEGTLELDGRAVAVRPGMLVQVPTGVVHRLRGENGPVTILVLGAPALTPDDEYLVDAP
jgi:mannose-6-phosphate isomerase-like protein (cupin superfamily)